MTTTLKRDAIERKDPLKLNKYQKKIVRQLLKIILSPLRDIKEKLAAFSTVLNVNLLLHTSEIFHKTERKRP